MKRLIILLSFLLFLLTAMPVNAQAPVVQAVLFYSPFCGHCHKVINQDIPPLSAEYNQEVTWKHVPEETREESGGVPTFVALEGDMLQVLFVNVTTPMGSELFGKAISEYDIPEPVGVPALIVGNTYMIGSADIPEQFPDLIAAGLEAGGIEWPAIPGLAENLTSLMPMQEPTDSSDPETDAPELEEAQGGEVAPAEDQAPQEAPEVQQPDLVGTYRSVLSVRERVLLDPIGNTLSILVLIGMLLSVVGIAARWGSGVGKIKTFGLHWSLLIVILLGIGVAAYLSFVETSGNMAICGPVGDCNTVQQSEYANLFGLIPIGILGLAGYALLLINWFGTGLKNRYYANLAKLTFFGITLAGTLFSIYLTFLEPFVIGATCIWCLSSAVIMTALTILSTDPARSAYRELRSR